MISLPEKYKGTSAPLYVSAKPSASAADAVGEGIAPLVSSLQAQFHITPLALLPEISRVTAMTDSPLLLMPDHTPCPPEDWTARL